MRPLVLIPLLFLASRRFRWAIKTKRAGPLGQFVS